jgi:hypothetical protein
MKRLGAVTAVKPWPACVTLGCDPQAPMSDLLACADQALYRAKAKGRNRVEASEPVVAAEVVPLQPYAESGERPRWRRIRA